jgi:3-oxoacyl-[acyl-carrier protein] reductase
MDRRLPSEHDRRSSTGPCLYSGDERARLGAFDPSFVSKRYLATRASLPTYGAAKAALNNVTLSLSKELAGTGVTSNGIMPGLIYTPQLNKWFIETAQRQGSDDPEFGKQYALKNIIHQTVSRLGQPMDIAAAVCFLASPLTDFMTGTTFRIDGGSTPTV